MLPHLTQKDFLETEGLIKKAYVRSRRTQADLLMINYCFQVNQIEYKGETVVYIPFENEDKAIQLQRQLELLQPGNTVTVWYDHHDPKKSYLHHGTFE